MSTTGKFVWYDLMTTDPDAAKDFYGKVVGWGTTPFPGDMAYTMWTAGEQPIGGVMPLPEDAKGAGAPPHWIAYVETPDVAEACERVEALGGSVLHPPQDIPSEGRFAVVSDPQGAVFSLYSSAPGRDAPPPTAAAPGRFSWHELATTDLEGAWIFYSEAFGWEKTEAMEMGDMGTYQMFGKGASPLGGMFRKPPEMPGVGWLYYAMVDDVDDAAGRVEALGGKILNGPMDVPGGDRIVQCTDPQGGMFALHSKGPGSTGD